MRKIFSDKVLLMIGSFIILVTFIPYILLGEGSVITVHDQLDGEIFTYLFGAKYLGSQAGIIGEWMGGIQKASLFPPSLLTVLLYAVWPPFLAFMSNQLVVVLIAFFGMYLFLNQLIGRRELSFVTALLYAFLPFYSVYGLSVSGIPLLLFALWELRERRNFVRNIGLVILYGLMSSFVLIGFAVIGGLWLYSFKLLVAKERKQYSGVYLATAILTIIYGFCNRNLVAQVLGIGSGIVSHKEEYVLRGQPFWESFSDMFFYGSGHAPSYHIFILVGVGILLSAGVVFYRKIPEDVQKQYRLLAGFFLAAVGIAVFYGFFQSASVCALRQKLGGFFVYFQFDRIYWFYPFLWYSMLALMLAILTQIAWGKYQKIVAFMGILLLALTAALVLWNSDFKRNARQLAGAKTSNSVTWEKYYGEEIFTQIREYIGREQNTYRVGSVALNPAVAAYNGFYTIDGYSNNYELEYKHKFREIIEKELEKSPQLQRYFDEWGNRCYLFSAEIGQSYYLEQKENRVITQLAWDREALKEIGCAYIFSGVEIENAGDIGLEYEKLFVAKQSDCRYGIYVYRVQ